MLTQHQFTFQIHSSLGCTYVFCKKHYFNHGYGLPPRSPRFEYSNRLGIIAELTRSAMHASVGVQLMASCHRRENPPPRFQMAIHVGCSFLHKAYNYMLVSACRYSCNRQLNISCIIIYVYNRYKYPMHN